MLTRVRSLLAAAGVVGLAAAAGGGGWHRFRGPHGNGVCDEKLDLLPDGPKKLWQVQTLSGRGSVAVVSGRVYIAGKGDAALTVSCLDAQTGAGVWTTPSRQDGGNHSTPTLADGKVYVLGYRGMLHCFDARTGRIDWQQALVKRGDKEPSWGHAGAPLIWEDLAICNVGAGVAVKKETGEIAWQHSGQGGYVRNETEELAAGQIAQRPPRK